MTKNEWLGLVKHICGCAARFVSDLVGNPEDWFSHNEAHFNGASASDFELDTFEPRCEKTDHRGFRPGPTQNRLYNHTRWLEAWNFVYRK